MAALIILLLMHVAQDSVDYWAVNARRPRQRSFSTQKKKLNITGRYRIRTCNLLCHGRARYPFSHIRIRNLMMKILLLNAFSLQLFN
jgi:hypothetical protein